MTITCDYCNVPMALLGKLRDAIPWSEAADDVLTVTDGRGFLNMSQRTPGRWDIWAEGDCDTEGRAAYGYMGSCMRRGHLIAFIESFCSDSRPENTQLQLFA